MERRGKKTKCGNGTLQENLHENMNFKTQYQILEIHHFCICNYRNATSCLQSTQK